MTKVVSPASDADPVGFAFPVETGPEREPVEAAGPPEEEAGVVEGACVARDWFVPSSLRAGMGMFNGRIEADVSRETPVAEEPVCAVVRAGPAAMAGEAALDLTS